MAIMYLKSVLYQELAGSPSVSAICLSFSKVWINQKTEMRL